MVGSDANHVFPQVDLTEFYWRISGADTVTGGIWWRNLRQYGIGKVKYIKYQPKLTPSSTNIDASTKLVKDADIQSALRTYISSNNSFFAGATNFTNGLYFPIHFDSTYVITRISGGETETSCVDFCAYHSYLTVMKNNINYNFTYAVIPNLSSDKCRIYCGGLINKL